MFNYSPSLIGPEPHLKIRIVCQNCTIFSLSHDLSSLQSSFFHLIPGKLRSSHSQFVTDFRSIYIYFQQYKLFCKVSRPQNEYKTLSLQTILRHTVYIYYPCAALVVVAVFFLFCCLLLGAHQTNNGHYLVKFVTRFHVEGSNNTMLNMH